MFNAETFATVVFSQAEFLYWTDPNTRAPASAPNSLFRPRVVLIKSEWEENYVLLRLPSGSPKLASRVAGWEPALEKSLRECCADLRAESEKNMASRAWWAAFIGVRGGTHSPPSGLFVLPLAADLDVLPKLPVFPWSYREPLTPAERVTNDGRVGPHRRTVGSEAGGPGRLMPCRGTTVITGNV